MIYLYFILSNGKIDIPTITAFSVELEMGVLASSPTQYSILCFVVVQYVMKCLLGVEKLIHFTNFLGTNYKGVEEREKEIERDMYVRLEMVVTKKVKERSRKGSKKRNMGNRER
jgi:hypothetical protein